MLSIGLILIFSGCSPLKKYEPKDRLWAIPEIEAFEKLDTTEEYDKEAILFIGSSSIRLWKTLERDMAPYPVIQRGYGGAHFRDMIYFTDRILADHPLSMVVCFVANDISGSPKDGKPKEVLRLFKYFVRQVRSKHPEIPILQIAITPTQSRWRKWEEIKKVNDLIKEYCNQTENLYYIDTVPTFLDEEGLTKTEWFIRDQLHLNETGYTVWNQLIKSEIERVKLFR
ncbi:MAG: GDSL-type esterase/lipase family protein [Flavobacteriaceae bacterium]